MRFIPSKHKLSKYILFYLVFFSSISFYIYDGQGISNSSWNANPQYNSGNEIIIEHEINEPFGVFDGDSLIEGTGDGNHLEYNIQWNRKELSWNQIEKINGSFCFNGYTVEDEPHNPETDPSHTITIRLGDIRTLPGDNIQAFLDNDTERIQNLFAVQLNEKRFNITFPIPENHTLFVTYNKTPSQSAWLYEEYVWKHHDYNISYLPVFEYSNNYLYSMYSDEYSAAGFSENDLHYIPPSGLWNWQRYVSRVTSRYAEFVDCWELWDEPNNYYVGETHWEEFFTIAITTALEINKNDPTAKIYFGCLGELNEIEFLEALFVNILDNDAYRELFDGICLHAQTLIPEAMIYEKFETYLPILNSHNWTTEYGKSILITDIGVPTNGSDSFAFSENDEYEQASRIVKNMAIASSIGIDTFIWNCYQDNPAWLTADNYLNSDYFYGLFTYDLTPKLGAFAFNLSSFLISNSTARQNAFYLESDLSLPDIEDHLFCYNFRKEDGTDVIILWQNYHSEITGELLFNLGLEEPVYSYNFTDGAAIKIMDSGANGNSLKITLGYDPIILTLKTLEPMNMFIFRFTGHFYNWFAVLIAPILLSLLGIGTIMGVIAKNMRSIKYLIIKYQTKEKNKKILEN